MEIPFILSLAYKDKIEEICKPLANMGLKHFVMYIVFNDDSTLVLSNVFQILKPYYQEALYHEDYTYSRNLITSSSNYYLCRDKGSISKKLQLLLSHKYNVCPTYNIVRVHSECTFVFSAIRDEFMDEEHLFYERTIKDFENFCINFVDAFLDVIIQYNPSYRFSFILTNKTLRDAVIKQGYEKNITLSKREQECVLLAMQGKKTKLIAKVLNISPYTVEEYLKHIRKQLNCESLTQALFECLNRGLVGRISPLNKENVTSRAQNQLQFARPHIPAN